MVMFKFNKRLWPIKAHYFLWNAGAVAVRPFLAVYAKQLGYSSVTVGLIFTILPICGMMAKPITGVIADYFKCRKKIFLTCEIITAVTLIILLHIPGTEKVAKCNFACNSNQSFLDTCLENSKGNDHGFTRLQFTPNTIFNCKLKCPLRNEWSHYSNESKEITFNAHVPIYLSQKISSNCAYFKVPNVTLSDGTIKQTICDGKRDKIDAVCDIKCDSELMNILFPIKEIPNDEVLEMHQFWVFLFFMVVSSMTYAVVISISDTICLEILGNEQHLYEQQKCFGALGWGLFAVIAGFIIDASSENENKNYAYAACLCGLLLTVDIVVSTTLKTEEKNQTVNILKDVSKLFNSLRMMVFCMWTIFIGMCAGLIWNFLFWFIEDLADENQEYIKTLEGLVVAMQYLCGELPFFFLSGWIMEKLGHANCMTLILFTTGVRCTLYSILRNPWFILPIEISNGITSGLFQSCMASYARIMTPLGNGSVNLGLVGTTFETLGISLGSLLGGYLFKAYSGSTTFRIFGISSLLLSILHAVVQCLLNWRTQDSKIYKTPFESIDEFIGEQQELKLV